MLRKYLFKIFALLSILQPITASAYSQSYYTKSSALNSGRWVKISVSKTGIHQISHDDLKKYGFDNPSSVSIYGYGGAALTSNSFSTYAPDDLKPTAMCHTSDGRLLFYGEADVSVSANTTQTIEVRRNLYDTKGYYFLTDSRNQEFKDNTDAVEPSYTPLTHHLSVSYIENDAQNPAQGGAIYHDRPFASEEIRDYEFDIYDFDAQSGMDCFSKGHIGYDFAALSTRPTNLSPIYPESFEVTSVVNGAAPLLTQETKFYSVASGHATLNGVKGNGKHVIKFKVKDTQTPTYAALDRAYIIYPRKNIIDGISSELIMNLPANAAGYDAVAIESPSADVKVWDITDAAAIVSCATKYDDGTLTVTAAIPYVKRFASSARRLVAFDTRVAYTSAEFAGEVANQNVHGLKAPAMVIITSDELKAAAQRLADIHKNTDRLEVAVVTQSDIFNEFSSGSRSAMGCRRFLKMLYDTAPDKIKHVLFYGRSSIDNRRSDALHEQLVCYETEDVDFARDRTKNFVTDKYFVMLENGFNEKKLHLSKMSLTVGRLDLNTEQEADNANMKIERFLKRRRTADIYHNVLVLSDDGDEYGHYFDAESAIAVMAESNSKMNFTRVHNVVYPLKNKIAEAGRSAIKNALKSGQGLFFYSGHCSHIAFTGERLYDFNLISQTTYDNYPFAMLSTCETFGFDRNPALVGTSMFAKDNGGAIGVIGSCRSVYMEYNRTISQAVVRAYAEADATTTIGEVLRLAHNNDVVTSDNDRAANAMCFNLCGDPSLKIGAPSMNVSIDRINGIAVEGQQNIAVSPLSRTTIEGRILDGENVAEWFNGDITIQFYDTPLHRLTTDHSGSDKNNYPITLDQSVLAKAVAKVSGGKFKLETAVPAARAGEDLNRIHASAISEDGLNTASGILKQIKIGDFDETADFDTTAPVIKSMYLNSPDVTDSSILGTSNTLYAEIGLPPSGLNVSPTIGGAMTVLLDGAISCNDYSITINSDATASMTCDLTDLLDGHHSLELTVRSNTGQSASRKINFTVQDGSVTARLYAEKRLAREPVEISLEHGFNSEPYGRVIVENAHGKTVFSAEGCSLPYTWDLKDNDGHDVADGCYRIYALLRDDLNYAATEKIEVVVIK